MARGLTNKGYVSREAATQSWVGRNPGTSVAIGVLIERECVTRVRRVVGVDDHPMSVGVVGCGGGGREERRDVRRRRGRSWTGDRRHDAANGRSACGDKRQRAVSAWRAHGGRLHPGRR